MFAGTNFDTYLSVYEGTCGDLTCVTGNDDQSETTDFDDFCPVTFVASTVTLNTADTTTYFVLVSGVVGESGDFEIGLSCVFPGCTDETACNYEAANIDDGSCTELDALGVCGGPCMSDEDQDGVCDDVDDCIGEFDACGVCNGPGPIYECGCAGIPVGLSECSEFGNVIWYNDISNCGDWVYDNGAAEIGTPWAGHRLELRMHHCRICGFVQRMGRRCRRRNTCTRINSTSGGNALMVDSDLFGTQDQYDANWIENSWVQTAAAIDCSANPYVAISFETRYRCYDNGGSRWQRKVLC